uniref:NADH-ubiquinone oxidoreductase chain 4 n=1 Tax=Bovicola ovis TaxID=186214 RepID=A0A386B289_9NEOP|nr:NADH dehydrogenase subunit 4 [Bovicola ovis]
MVPLLNLLFIFTILTSLALNPGKNHSSFMTSVVMSLSLAFLVILTAGGETLSVGTNLDLMSKIMMVLLCLVLVFSSSTESFSSCEKKMKPLMLLGLICSLFFSTDSLLIFFMMFEASMIPILFLILGFGHQPERIPSGMFMLMFTLVSSIPLALVVVYMALWEGVSSFSIMTIHSPLPIKGVIIACILAFLVKLPLYGFHIWLPMAHVEAPLEGSMALAGILLKLGGFGLYRFWSILGYMFGSWVGFTLWSLSLFGSVMAAIMALTSTDVKAIVAYSSVSHMNFMILAFLSGKAFSLKALGITSLSHALGSPILFFLVTILYGIGHSRNLLVVKGIFSILPTFQLLSFMVWAMNMSPPPFFSFMGEISSIGGALFFLPTSLVGLVVLVVLSSLYSMNIFGISSLALSNWQTTCVGSQSKLNLISFSIVLSIVFFFSSSTWDPCP